MEKNAFQEISVLIAGRAYPLLVNNDEEPAVRDLVKRLNQEIEAMHLRYASKLSKQDILAMLLLTYGKELMDLRERSNLQPLEQKLDEINELLDEYLPH